VLLTNRGRKGGKKRGSRKQYEDVRLKSNSVSIYIAVNTLKMQKLLAWFKKKPRPKYILFTRNSL